MIERITGVVAYRKNERAGLPQASMEQGPEAVSGNVQRSCRERVTQAALLSPSAPAFTLNTAYTLRCSSSWCCSWRRGPAHGEMIALEWRDVDLSSVGCSRLSSLIEPPSCYNYVDTHRILLGEVALSPASSPISSRVFSSKSRFRRSRAVSLPWACWLSMRSGPPMTSLQRRCSSSFSTRSFIFMV